MLEQEKMAWWFGVCNTERLSDLAKKKKCRQNLEKKKKRKEKWVPVSYALVRNKRNKLSVLITGNVSFYDGV